MASAADDSVPSAGSDKAAWRAWVASWPPDGDHAAVLEGIRVFLREWPFNGRVLVYRAMGAEVNLDGLLGEFPCAVTRTWPQGRLTVHAAEVPMERHRWGYLQPIADAPELDRREIGVVLAPGLLFDRFGGRLGQGGGYYDRLFPTLRPDIPRVGICTRVTAAAVPMEPHDIPMTHLADESGVVAALVVDVAASTGLGPRRQAGDARTTW